MSHCQRPNTYHGRQVLGSLGSKDVALSSCLLWSKHQLKQVAVFPGTGKGKPGQVNYAIPSTAVVEVCVLHRLGVLGFEKSRGRRISASTRYTVLIYCGSESLGAWWWHQVHGDTTDVALASGLGNLSPDFWAGNLGLDLWRFRLDI